jgi:hypothetical protein
MTENDERTDPHSRNDREEAERDGAARHVLARIMGAHASRILFHDDGLANEAWAALASETPRVVARRPDNWLEQECQALYRFLQDCWIGTGGHMEEGSASHDYFLWRERAAEMALQARAYGRSERIREALQDPAGALAPGVGDHLNAMCEPGYEFDPRDAIRLRELLARREANRSDPTG